MKTDQQKLISECQIIISKLARERVRVIIPWNDNWIDVEFKRNCYEIICTKTIVVSTFSLRTFCPDIVLLLRGTRKLPAENRWYSWHTKTIVEATAASIAIALKGKITKLLYHKQQIELNQIIYMRILLVEIITRNIYGIYK